MLSLLFGAGCNLNSDPVPVGSSAGPVGSYQDLEGDNVPGAFVVDSNVVWGLTYRMIENFLEAAYPQSRA